MSKSVFFTGATGFIGGATLSLLLSHDSTKSYTYAALVRSKEKAALLEKLGVRPVIASLDDAAVLAAEAELADIVVHTADSADHLAAAEAITSGMKKRGDNPILIHISGTGVLADDARGEHSTDEIYSDLDPAHINSLPDTAFHRSTELAVLAAAPHVLTHIVSPPTIYGIADNTLVRAGIANALSISIPALIRVCVERGQGGVIGKGRNVWPNVHIDDIAWAIVTVLEAAVAGKTATGREGYYFGETGEHSLYDVSAEISKALSTHGIGSPEPTEFSEEEVMRYFHGYFLGSNSRCRAERTRQLGWTPTRTNADFLKSITAEVEYILKNEGKKGTL